MKKIIMVKEFKDEILSVSIRGGEYVIATKFNGNEEIILNRTTRITRAMDLYRNLALAIEMDYA